MYKLITARAILGLVLSCSVTFPVGAQVLDYPEDAPHFPVRADGSLAPRPDGTEVVTPEEDFGGESPELVFFQRDETYYEDHRGHGEKYFGGSFSVNGYTDVDGPWYYLLPDGDLYEYTPPYDRADLHGVFVEHKGVGWEPETPSPEPFVPQEPMEEPWVGDVDPDWQPEPPPEEGEGGVAASSVVPPKNPYSNITVSTTRNITIRVHDWAVVDGDYVSLYWNGKLIPECWVMRLTWPGKWLVLPMQPGVNKLRAVWHSFGTLSPGTLGVEVFRDQVHVQDAEVWRYSDFGFQRAGIWQPYRDEALIPLSATLTFGYVYVTIPQFQFPEAVAHMLEAQALGFPRLCTVEKRKDLAELRRDASRNFYRKPPPAGLGAPRGLRQPGQDYDEYPEACYPQNGTITPRFYESAHVRPIDTDDNQGAGRKIGSQHRQIPIGWIVERAHTRF